MYLLKLFWRRIHPGRERGSVLQGSLLYLCFIIATYLFIHPDSSGDEQKGFSLTKQLWEPQRRKRGIAGISKITLSNTHISFSLWFLGSLTVDALSYFVIELCLEGECAPVHWLLLTEHGLEIMGTLVCGTCGLQCTSKLEYFSSVNWFHLWIVFFSLARQPGWPIQSSQVWAPLGAEIQGEGKKVEWTGKAISRQSFGTEKHLNSSTASSSSLLPCHLSQPHF